MSVLRVGVMILCDGPSDTEECPSGANWMDAVTTTALRSRMAREDGWLTALPGGKDRCQACAKKSLGIAEAPSPGEGHQHVWQGSMCVAENCPDYCFCIAGGSGGHQRASGRCPSITGSYPSPEASDA